MSWFFVVSAGLWLAGAACSAGGGAAPRCTPERVRAAAADGGQPSWVEGAPCIVQRATCPAACALPGCAVESDVEVSCPDPELARSSLGVAATGQSTFVMAEDSENARWFEIDRQGAGGEIAGPQREQMSWRVMAAGADDVLHLAAWDGPLGDVMQGGSYHYARTAAGWTRELIRKNDSFYLQAPRALEIGPDGAPHVLLALGPDETAIARRAEDGSWAVGPAEDWPVLTLDGAGAEVQLRAEAGPDALFARARRGTTVLPFDMALGSPLDWVTTPAPAHTLDAAAPPFASAAYRAEAIHVGWLDGDATKELALPDTGRVVYPDYRARDRSCFGTEHLQQTGFESVAFNLARADDGAAWLAYAVTEVDRDYELGAICPGEGASCFCGPTNTVDRSVGELHVLRVPLDGGPAVEALNLPLEPPMTGDTNYGSVVRLRAHGPRVSIAARVRAGDGRPKLRVVTLEAR
jgi:hypothetical protein